MTGKTPEEATPCTGSVETVCCSGRAPELEVSILIVDDEPRASQSLCDLLAPLGHCTVKAASVAEALTCLQKHKFTLALVDLNLPDGSGQEIMRYIHDHQIPTRFIVISGQSTFDQATQALRSGACDFIRKPYQPKALLESIAREIAKSRTQSRYEHIHEELKGSEALHRFIVNNSPDMIYMLDSEGFFPLSTSVSAHCWVLPKTIS